MARVLISAIGTGRSRNMQMEERKYDNVSYRFQDEGLEYETPFIAAALARHLKVDRIYLVGTGRSIWEVVYDYFVEEAGLEWDIGFREALEQKIKQSGAGRSMVKREELNRVGEVIDDYLKSINPSAVAGSRCYLMDYGVTQQELQNNIHVFMDIANELGLNDDIYLDITHSFRSIPLFMYIMLDFVETLRLRGQLKLSGVYYGMLDASRELGYVPVVDLKILFEISRWVKAVYDFLKYSNGYLMAELLAGNAIAEPTRKISELININYLPDLRREVDRMKGILARCGDITVPVFQYLMPYVNDFIKTFSGVNSNAEFQFRLAGWHFEHRRYASGYICLAESIITRLLEIYRKEGLKIDLTEKNAREKGKKLLYKLEFSGADCRRLFSLYKEINNIRNRIAHAGFDEQTKGLTHRQTYDVERDIEAARSYMEGIKTLLFQGDLDRVVPEITRLPAEIPFRDL